MIQKEKYIGIGIDQDTAPDKRKSDVYWDAENIRIINSGRTLSIKPINGSELFVSASQFPDNLVGYCVVGNVEINDKLYLFITNNTGTIDTPVPGSPKNYLVEINKQGNVNIILSNSTGTLNNEYDTPGTFDWICPVGVTSVIVGCYGGGAPGNGIDNAGAGGAYAESTLTVVPGTTYKIIVGAGTTNGNVTGKDSSFNTALLAPLVLAKGGPIGGIGSTAGCIGDTLVAGGSAVDGGVDVGDTGGAGGGPVVGSIAGIGGGGGYSEDENGFDGTYAGGGGGAGIVSPYPPNTVGIGGAGASGAVVLSYDINFATSTDFKLSCQNDLDIVANYENENIIKLYWTDGVTPLKFINVQDASNAIQVIEEVTLSNISVALQAGGALIAGNIQYAYSLYNLNGSESALSPLSKMVSVSENMKGFESGRSTGLSCALSIDITGNFEYIRIYSIHYQELNQTPKITLIADAQITSPSTYNMVDDGNILITSLSPNEFASIGGRYIVAQTIASKRSRLFLGNYSVENFDFDFDARAFSHAVSSSNYKLIGDSVDRTNFTTELPEAINDCINFDYPTYKYIKNSASTYGATGLYIQLSITLSSLANTTAAFNTPSLKKGEIYRFGIVFYNKYGQKSPVKWITDLKIPYGPDGSRHKKAVPIIQLINGGNTVAATAGAVGYQLVMVERKPWDRTIISQGFIVPSARYVENNGGAAPLSPYNHPYFLTKDIYNVSNAGAVLNTPYTLSKDWNQSPVNIPEERSELMCFYSSDTIFEESLESAEFIIPMGTNTLSNSNSTRVLDLDTAGAVVVDNSYNSFKLDGYSLDGIGTNVMDSMDNGNIPCIFFAKNYNGYGVEGSHLPVSLTQSSIFVKKGETKVIDNLITLSNTVQIPFLCNDGTYSANYIHKFPACVALSFVSNGWHYDGPDPYGKFIAGGADGTRRLPIVDLYRTLQNQYGGGSYEAKQRNEYLIVGSIRPVDGTVNTETGVGDIYLSPLSVNRCDPENYISSKYWNIYEYIKLDYIENNHNVFGRSDNMYEWAAGLNTNTNYSFFRIDDNHKLLGAYNQKPTLVKAYSKPANFNMVDKFKASVQSSQEKFPNEVIDSWLKFPVNETKNLEGVFGQINKLYNFKGEIISFQDKGVSVLSINPRIQTQATDGINIELGIGAVLYDYKYITTIAGCRDKKTITDDGQSLFYYDIETNTINVVEDDKFSTMLSVRDILENNPDEIIHAVYHKEMDEVLFIFTDFSLVYHKLAKKFISKFTHETPLLKRHITFGKRLLFLKPGEGFMSKYKDAAFLPSSITYLVCPHPGFEKAFHNLEYRLVGENFNKFAVTSPYGISGIMDLVSYNKFGIYRTHLPRKEASIERFREIYIFAKLIHEGVADYALDDVTVMYDLKG